MSIFMSQIIEQQQQHLNSIDQKWFFEGNRVHCFRDVPFNNDTVNEWMKYNTTLLHIEIWLQKLYTIHTPQCILLR